MVFRKKLPNPAERRRRSAQELANELGVELNVVLDVLRSVGEYVGSPRKRTIEEPVAVRVYAHLGQTYEPTPVKPLSPWQTRDQGGPRKTPRMASIPAAGGDTRSPRRFDSRDRSAGIGDRRSDAAAAWASQEWKLYEFTLVEQDAWRAAGLRAGQAKLARDLRDAGLRPADLDVDIFGWTVAKRLRGGETPGEVVRLLRQKRSREAS